LADEILATLHGKQNTVPTDLEPIPAHKDLLEKLLDIIQQKAIKFEYVKRPASFTAADKTETRTYLAMKLGAFVDAALDTKDQTVS
jgi:hypothetical protein